MKYDQNIFKMPESIDKEKYIICTYFCEGYTSDLLTKVGSMAIEQTTGTWAPVPLGDSGSPQTSRWKSYRSS